MLHFARAQVGKPFSNVGMARSLIAPRTSDDTNSNWVCAELVAACLQRGGLMSPDSNPGAATPHSLYKMYSKQAAASANPYVLRGMNLTLNGLTSSMSAVTANSTPITQPLLLTGNSPSAATAQRHAHASISSQPCSSSSSVHQPSNVGVPSRRPDSPPRASFKVMNSRGNCMDAHSGQHCAGPSSCSHNLSISLSGLSANPVRR